MDSGKGRYVGKGQGYPHVTYRSAGGDSLVKHLRLNSTGQYPSV